MLNAADRLYGLEASGDIVVTYGEAHIDPTLCAPCRGTKGLCGLGYCPLLQSVYSEYRLDEVGRRDLIGATPPSVFVGRGGYPKVQAGPMLPPAGIEVPTRGEDLFGRPLGEILSLRMPFYRTSQKVRVADREPGRWVEDMQGLAQAERPVDTEVHLSKPISAQTLGFDGFSAPVGKPLQADYLRVIGNIQVARKVDALVSDTDALATTAMDELYSHRGDVDEVQRLLASGLLGRGQRRKLVPTRWAITATDDTLSKQVLDSVKHDPIDGAYEVYRHAYIGNRFYILLAPRPWMFEMLEAWQAGSLWGGYKAPIGDHEGWHGRKDYASYVTGAYYAARLMVAEHLRERRRQMAALVYREITDEYLAPLGVWVIRETVRAALRGKPREFDTLDAAEAFIESKMIEKDGMSRSWFLKTMRVQRTLLDY